jgi:hypothetical protein
MLADGSPHAVLSTSEGQHLIDVRGIHTHAQHRTHAPLTSGAQSRERLGQVIQVTV